MTGKCAVPPAGSIAPPEPELPSWENAVEMQKILADDAIRQDLFGYSVAISADGQTCIIGAYGEDDVLSASGAVYVFTRDGDNWSQQTRLKASDPRGSAYFGWSLDISDDGNTCIIGANRDSENFTRQGAAYVFGRDGDTWTEQEKFQYTSPAENDYFGHSVSISGDGQTSIVGTSTNSNKVAVYVRTGDTWALKQTVQAQGSSYGYSLSLSFDGLALVVSAYLTNIPGFTQAGTAFVYTRTAGGNFGATNITEIRPDGLALSDRYGWCVDMSGDGNTCVVTTIYKNVSSGYAYIWARTEGNTWVQQAQLQTFEIAAGDYFGQSCALSHDGNTCLVTARYQDDTVTNSGSFYIFNRVEGEWTGTKKMQASDPAELAQYAFSGDMSSDGKTVIIGAYNDDTGGENAGASYLYKAG